MRIGAFVIFRQLDNPRFSRQAPQGFNQKAFQPRADPEYGIRFRKYAGGGRFQGLTMRRGGALQQQPGRSRSFHDAVQQRMNGGDGGDDFDRFGPHGHGRQQNHAKQAHEPTDAHP